MCGTLLRSTVVLSLVVTPPSSGFFRTWGTQGPLSIAVSTKTSRPRVSFPSVWTHLYKWYPHETLLNTLAQVCHLLSSGALISCSTQEEQDCSGEQKCSKGCGGERERKVNKTNKQKTKLQDWRSSLRKGFCIRLTTGNCLHGQLCPIKIRLFHVVSQITGFRPWRHDHRIDGGLRNGKKQNEYLPPG